ncbi:AraC family transcriptional regulator [Pseudogulbenkiania subflava]|uniref:AraC family transcriptional regulator n=1 Tax=Pseudogulbenkiania subflava DSM 22618 TaxID=1123014 RepID=A0A1Y6CAG0_9NEIS|nr:AraC family transcriptional regulator [Pseudogulbenkiania subflava]SMF43020.1 AraC family transcriptional regulator [Pseudogulbenkiania subflava DSM 22618]
MPRATLPVYDTLTQTRAELERNSSLGDGLSVALWQRNQLEDTVYSRPGHHTLSLYLEGGFDIRRRDQPGLRGAPDKLCILPAEHESDWRVSGQIRFLHLYFAPDRFDALALTLLDREARDQQLYDRTYMDDPWLAAVCRQLAGLDWDDPHGRLAGNALGHEVLAHLMLTQTGRRRSVTVKGGLAPAQRRRVQELIEARLDSVLTVGELAAELALSEYHFARMFRASFGQPPHAWILQRRLVRAREALAGGDQALADIAASCGFASASHLANRFRAALGVTPGEYRRWAGR